MAITVTRKTGLIGSLGKITVRLNGVKAAALADNQTLHLNLPTADTVMQVTQQGWRSNKLTVKDGDKVWIEFCRNAIVRQVLMVSTPLLGSLFFSDYAHGTWITLFFILFWALALFLFDTFQLIKVP